MHDGRLVFRSTKTTSKSEARRIAQSWEDAAKTHATEMQIRKVFEDIHERIHGTRMRSDSVREFFLRWMGAREKDLAASTCQSYQSSADHFLNFLGDRGERPIAELTVSDLTGFRDHEAKRTSSTTATNRMKTLKPWLIDAWREGLLPDNIATKMPRSTVKRAGTKRRPFTMKEVQKLIENASPEWQGMILMGLYTGQRLGDAARLSWTEVDLLRAEISLSTGKTGRRQIIPLVGAWKKWLMDNAGDEPAGAVFPEAHRLVANAGGRTGTLSNQFYEIMVSAGIAEKRSHGKAKKGRSTARTVNEVSFHCLRYTATTMLKAAGVPEAIARDIIGHDSAAVSRNYTVIDEDTKRAALEKLPETI